MVKKLVFCLLKKLICSEDISDERILSRPINPKIFGTTTFEIYALDQKNATIIKLNFRSFNS